MTSLKKQIAEAIVGGRPFIVHELTSGTVAIELLLFIVLHNERPGPSVYYWPHCLFSCVVQANTSTSKVAVFAKAMSILININRHQSSYWSKTKNYEYKHKHDNNNVC